MWDRIWNIWRKEVVDNMRDRKGMRQALLGTLFIGVLYAVMNPALNSLFIRRAQEPITVPAQGIEYAGQAFLDAMAQYEITLEPYEGDLQAVIERGEEAAGLIIPEGFTDSITSEQPAQLTLLVNQTAGGPFGGGFSSQRLDLAISTYNQQVTMERIQSRDLPTSLLAPITLNAQDLATPAQLAGQTAVFTFPILLAVILLQGSAFIAIDVTAGEKERGTLEALLVTPASDLEIMVGKLLAIFTISLLPIILTFVGYWVSANLLPESLSGGNKLPFSVVIQSVLLAIPLGLLANVVMMIIAARTRTFKDAQSAMTPISFMATIVALVAAFLPPVTTLAYAIPLYGTASLLGVVASGGAAPTFAAIALSIGGSLLAAIVGLAIATRIFDRERLLYGSSS